MYFREHIARETADANATKVCPLMAKLRAIAEGHEKYYDILVVGSWVTRTKRVRAESSGK